MRTRRPSGLEAEAVVDLEVVAWRDVSLTEDTLRVVESKSEEGERLLALSSALVSLLIDRYTKTPYKADSDYVFSHPQTGARLGSDRYRVQLRKALAKAEIPDADRVRPFHDARHAALTHLALTPGASELVLMATAGHRSFATTRKCLHLAGRAFPEAAAGLSDRLLGDETCTPFLYPSEVTSADLSPSQAASEAA